MRAVFIGLALAFMVVAFLNSGKSSSSEGNALKGAAAVNQDRQVDNAEKIKQLEEQVKKLEALYLESNNSGPSNPEAENVEVVAAVVEEPAEAKVEETAEEFKVIEEPVVVVEEVEQAERQLDSNEEIAKQGARRATANGDPHFKTWQGEHYEYHGQCDLVLTKDPAFAKGLGLDVHIRTKLVRFWSYIKTVSIRIGTDILEVEGAADNTINNYWFNYEFQGELETMGGFPVSFRNLGTHKREFEIDLSQSYPGQKIIVQIYKEFVRVDFKNPSEEAFGNTSGLLGDYKTGNTLARDGATVLDDFYALGQEWQVHPFEPKLFHTMEEPQFPKKCIEPEDPRGERRRRLDESSVTEAQAEAACAVLKDPLDKKDCIYDILATQDLDMVGAF